MILSLNWDIRSEIRLEEMNPWTSGLLSLTACGKKEADVKSSVETSREANLLAYMNSEKVGIGDGELPTWRAIALITVRWPNLVNLITKSRLL